MRIPLHIRPDDFSPEAARARVLLHAHMAALNPKGFRTPRTGRHSGRPKELLRVDREMTLARSAGGAALVHALRSALERKAAAS